jgi:uncharacterized protein
MEPFAMALLGGALVGLAATLLLAFNGRVAGISGIFAGLVLPSRDGSRWRWAFVAGLLVGGFSMTTLAPSLFAIAYDRLPWMVAIAGLLVGFGTRLGGGCTSGHGVCGVSRLSRRSIVAAMTFVATGALTVAILSSFGDGS